mmetsp:Transcript_90134/g.176479  ORF Transcript_90134/g.176479 Transcript_90134/m.176479 type:complete len:333 (+) Transcript_90134:111-1109(+)
MAAISMFVGGYIFWVSRVRMKSYYRLDNLDEPKSATQAQPVTNNVAYHDFPFIGTKALEFGLFRTYAIPSISKILVSTKELTDHCAQRYDDTDLIVREFMEQRVDSWRATLAIRRLNALHGKYKISNEDYLYVLAIFAVIPYRWIDMYGYRPAHSLEKLSSYVFWNEVGSKMGIKDIPSSYEELELYMDDFEVKNMRFHPNNAHLAVSTLELLLSPLPSILHPIGREIVYAMCDRPLRAAMGFPDPIFGLSEALHSILVMSGWVTRILLPPRLVPARRTPYCPFDNQTEPVMGTRLCPVYNPYEATYKEGYCIEQLGPKKYVEEKELGELYA